MEETGFRSEEKRHAAESFVAPTNGEGADRAPLSETSIPSSGGKTQERLQAQAEIFADKGVKEFSEDQRALLQYSAELSKITDLNNLPKDTPEELVELIQKHKDAYISFLRQERQIETSFIEANVKTYNEKFRPTILELKAKIAQGNFRELPEYLGSGSNGSAFRMEAGDETYAAKFSGSLSQANFEIKPLIRAMGIPHTAQLESYSFEDGVVVMGLLPGTDVTKLYPESAPEYSDEQIIQLIETVRNLDARGLTIDPKPSNFIFDSEQGFSVLDYHLKKDRGRYKLPQEIMDLSIALTTRKFEKLDYMAPDYEERANKQAVERNKIFLPMMVRFIGILQARFPDVLAEWQNQHDMDKKDSNTSSREIIDREYIPQDPAFKPYLNKLEEMGF